MPATASLRRERRRNSGVQKIRARLLGVAAGATKDDSHKSLAMGLAQREVYIPARSK